MYLKFLQKLWCLGSLGPKQAKRSAVKKVRWNSWKDNFVTKSFRLSTKTKLSILLNLPFPFVSFPLQWGCATLAEAPLLSTLSLFFLFHCSTFCRASPSVSCPASILTTAFGVPNIFISLCSASAMFAVLQINSMNATRNSLSLNE